MFIPLLSKSAFLCTQEPNHTNIHSESPPMHVHAWNPIPDPACLTGLAGLSSAACDVCIVSCSLDCRWYQGNDDGYRVYDILIFLNKHCPVNS